MASLLRLCDCFEFSKDWFSTTSDSRTDWCGITPQSGQPNVSGVADVMIERDDAYNVVCVVLVGVALHCTPDSCYMYVYV